MLSTITEETDLAIIKAQTRSHSKVNVVGSNSTTAGHYPAEKENETGSDKMHCAISILVTSPG